jgi:hypothetical protein
MQSQSTFDEEALKLGKELAELVIRKQRDYGKGNIMNNIYPAEVVLGTRLSEKLNRFKNLVESGAEPENESLIDTVDDIVGLGLVLRMYLDGSFELPLKDISKS